MCYMILTSYSLLSVNPNHTMKSKSILILASLAAIGFITVGCGKNEPANLAAENLQRMEQNLDKLVPANPSAAGRIDENRQLIGATTEYLRYMEQRVETLENEVSALRPEPTPRWKFWVKDDNNRVIHTTHIHPAPAPTTDAPFWAFWR
jgi:hypothetical protein